MTQNIFQFIGRFHPLIVHLPIGFLLLHGVLVWLSKRERFESIKIILPVTLLLGVLSGAAACATGWLLAQKGDYDPTLLQKHQWLGIATAVASAIMYFVKASGNRFAWLGVAVLLTLTGHFGGSLTHGENYLVWSPPTEGGGTDPTKQSIVDIPNAVLYSDVIAPILQSKCYSCHNDKKQKGKLRLDSPNFIRLGGENGAIALAGQADKSEMYRRITLDLNHDDRMPPKGKPQLTTDETLLIHWWIQSGLTFDKKIKDLNPPADAQNALNKLNQSANKLSDAESDLPTDIPAFADKTLIDSLKKLGIVVVPVAADKPFLSVNLFATPKVDAALLSALLRLTPQLISLKGSSKNVSDSVMVQIGQLKNLRQLYLNNSRVTDTGIVHLQSLQHLKYLNLVHTAVSDAAIPPLSKITSLRRIFLFKTQISSDGIAKLRQSIAGIDIDTGGYQVPTLASDTTVLKRIAKTGEK